MKGVEKNEIVVFTHKGEEARAAFLDTWENLEEKDSVGISLRWAVVAGDDDKMKVQLQAMPASASTLSDKPTMRADNIPIIKLWSSPSAATCLMGTVWPAPSPPSSRRTRRP